MKTILLAITHYGTSNREYFLKCLREYNSFKNYLITAHILLTNDLDCSEFKNIKIEKHILPESLKHWFVHETKPIMYENRNNFDYFIYCEDDVLITEENFESFAFTQKNLPLPYICGFLRYELLNNDDYKYLFDNHPIHSQHRKGNVPIKQTHTINGLEYIEPYNPHQGCHILTLELMKYLEDKSPIYFEKKPIYVGILEGCASDIYYNCGLTKIIPKNNISKFLVHHLPNKYVNTQPQYYNKDTTPNEVKILL